MFLENRAHLQSRKLTWTPPSSSPVRVIRLGGTRRGVSELLVLKCEGMMGGKKPTHRGDALTGFNKSKRLSLFY